MTDHANLAKDTLDALNNAFYPLTTAMTDLVNELAARGWFSTLDKYYTEGSIDWQSRALLAEKRVNELKLENNKLRLQLMRRNRQ